MNLETAIEVCKQIVAGYDEFPDSVRGDSSRGELGSCDNLSRDEVEAIRKLISFESLGKMGYVQEGIALFIFFARRFAIAFERRMVSSEDKIMLRKFRVYLDKLDKMILISPSELDRL